MYEYIPHLLTFIWFSNIHHFLHNSIKPYYKTNSYVGQKSSFYLSALANSCVLFINEAL